MYTSKVKAFLVLNIIAYAWAGFAFLFFSVLPVSTRAEGSPASFQPHKTVLPAVQLPDGTRVSEHILGLPGLSNVGRISPGVFRGAQPGPEGYATLKKMGIRTVINLRVRYSEKDTVERAGMRSREFPMRMFGAVDPATVRKIITIMADPENQPVFIHCKKGQDRTGVIVAVYRMEIDGWSTGEAVAEMRAFGFHDIWFRFNKFVQEYERRRTR